MTFWETIERGEYVMFALAALLLITIIIWWVRAVKLRKPAKGYPFLMHRVRDQVVEGDIDNARQLCEASETPGGRMVCAGLNHVGKPMWEVARGMSEVSDVEKNRMAKGARWLRCIAVISPLIGLGGTLVGIIDRLRDLGEAGATVDTAAVCGALAPTIVTTVAGLVTGIFALVALTCLEGTINAARRRLDQLGAEFTSLLNEPS